MHSSSRETDEAGDFAGAALASGDFDPPALTVDPPALTVDPPPITIDPC